MFILKPVEYSKIILQFTSIFIELSQNSVLKAEGLFKTLLSNLNKNGSKIEKSFWSTPENFLYVIYGDEFHGDPPRISTVPDLQEYIPTVNTSHAVMHPKKKHKLNIY